MYIILLPNHEWWAAFDLETAEYFAKRAPSFAGQKAKIFKCVEKKMWEEIELKEDE